MAFLHERDGQPRERLHSARFGHTASLLITWQNYTNTSIMTASTITTIHCDHGGCQKRPGPTGRAKSDVRTVKICEEPIGCVADSSYEAGSWCSQSGASGVPWENSKENWHSELTSHLAYGQLIYIYTHTHTHTPYIYIWTVEKLRSSKITNFNPQTHCSQRRIRLAFGTRNCKTNSQRSYQLFNTPNIYQEGGWGCKNEYSVAINLISCAAQTDTKWSPHSSWHSDEEYPHTKTVAAGHDVMITIHSCLTHQFPAGVHHLCNSVRRCANRSARNCYTCPGRAHVVRWRQVAMAHSQPITCILLNGTHRANHLNTIKWHTQSQPPEYY